MMLEISFDDGSRHDVRAAEMIAARGLASYSTVFLPNFNGLLKSELFEIARLPFDFGGHTVNHPPDLKRLDDEDLWWEINENKRWLEDTLGRKVNRFCYPRGRYDLRVIEAVKAAGYLSARTTLVGRIITPEDPFRLHTTVQAFPRREYGGEDWFDWGKKKLAETDRLGGYFHFWFHSADLERLEQWDKFGKFLDLINEKNLAA